MNFLLRLVLLIAIFGLGSVSTRAQTTTVIPFAEASRYVGQRVAVEGVVAKVFTSRNGNTFLDFGAAYPNELFTGWIPQNSALSADPSLWSLRGKKVKVTGIIELYRGKPEIKIVSTDQLVLE
jgi:hypothetical protein